MTRFSRRELLSAALLLATTPAWARTAAQGKDSNFFLSAASTNDDTHWVQGLRWNGAQLTQEFQLPLPERGHHVEVHPAGRYFVMVARRPGTWLVLGDAQKGEILETLRVPENRHLFGHGIFSADGKQFYTTESDFDDLTGDSGLIVSWDVDVSDTGLKLKRAQEFRSYGVGPHELLLMPDQQTIAIANGGIRTHPSHDRDNLNVDTMVPSLAYIDRTSGALLEQHFLPDEWHQASIRHFDVNAEGQIAFGMQFEGEPWMDVPLVATHRRGEELRLLSAPQPLQGQMKQYVGSVRFAEDGKSFAASCPRGNMITFWDAASGEVLNSVRSRDGCGVCAVEQGYFFTAGSGRIAWYDTATQEVHEFETGPELHLLWDNHLSQV
jgi:hypothetical protein